MAHSHLDEEKVCAALIAAGGIVSVAAKALGCVPKTVYDYLKKSEACRDAQNEAFEAEIDFYETQLKKQAKKGDTKAVTFFLETKGKKRGYVKRSELGGPDGGSIPVDFTLSFDK